MAEFIGDEGFLETIVDDTRRPANHKAEWTEAALRELEMLVMRKETWVGEWNEIIKLLEVEPRQSAPQQYINIQKDRFSPEVFESRWKDEDIAKWRALKNHSNLTWEEIAASINSNHRPVNSQTFPKGFSKEICIAKAIEMKLYERRKNKPGAGRPKLEWKEEWLDEMKAFGPSAIEDGKVKQVLRSYGEEVWRGLLRHN